MYTFPEEMQDFLKEKTYKNNYYYFCNAAKYQEREDSESVDTIESFSIFSDKNHPLALISVAIATIPTTNHIIGSITNNFFI